MKTQAWKPPVEPEQARKEGIFVDELVQLTELDTGWVGELPAVAAFVSAVEFISKNKPFEIRDTTTFELWLAWDGQNLKGAHSLHQVVQDTGVILDAIVRKNLKDFSKNIMSLIEQDVSAGARPATVGTPEESSSNSEEGTVNAVTDTEPVAASDVGARESQQSDSA